MTVCQLRSFAVKRTMQRVDKGMDRVQRSVGDREPNRIVLSERPTSLLHRRAAVAGGV